MGHSPPGPASPSNESDLEAQLAEPTDTLIAMLSGLRGDILIIGAGGKMGPSLARLAVDASRRRGREGRVIAVSRFGDASTRAELDRHGVATIAVDLFDRGAVDRLPDAPWVIYMAGRKFGTTGDTAATWATNAWLAGAVAQRFGESRIVAFSTGNVYPLTDPATAGPAEGDPVAPLGDYAQSALAREQVLEFFSRRNGTPMMLLRLNYAIEPRYGVLRDLADRIVARQSVDLTTGSVNLIWQRDANAIALRSLAHCTSPPTVLNVTGRPAHRVRDLATALGARLGIAPIFEGGEGPTALLSDAARCEALFGAPEVTIATMLDRVAAWVAAGGRSLHRPTHFQQRDGRF